MEEDGEKDEEDVGMKENDEDGEDGEDGEDEDGDEDVGMEEDDEDDEDDEEADSAWPPFNYALVQKDVTRDQVNQAVKQASEYEFLKERCYHQRRLRLACARIHGGGRRAGPDSSSVDRGRAFCRNR